MLLDPIQPVQSSIILSFSGQSQAPGEPWRDSPDTLPPRQEFILQLIGNTRAWILQSSRPEWHIPSFSTYEILTWSGRAIERGRRQARGQSRIGSLDVNVRIRENQRQATGWERYLCIARDSSIKSGTNERETGRLGGRLVLDQ